MLRRLVVFVALVFTSVVASMASASYTPTCVTVQAGDGWFAVANRFGVSTADRDAFIVRLQAWNQATRLHPGEGICIDPADPALTSTSTSRPPSSTTTSTSSLPTTSTSTSTTTTSSSTIPATTSTTAPTSTSTTSSTSTTVPVPGQGFSATFETAADLDQFAFQLHTDEQWPLNPEGWDAEHNEMCEGPTTHRHLSGGQRTGAPVQANGLAYWCAPGGAATGHFMTSADTVGLAVLSFSPAQTFTNVTKVCWSQNTNNLGEGKWTSMHIIPADVVRENGGVFHYVAGESAGLDTSEIPTPAGALTMISFRGSFQAWQGTGDWGGTRVMWEGGPADMDPSPAPRHRHCVEDIPGPNLRFSIERPNGQVQTFDRPGTIPTGEVYVIWQDGSYNPAKHAGTGFLTWHWDDVEVR